MKQLKHFLTTSLIGGLTVILPATILLMVFIWLFNLINYIIAPVTNVLTEHWAGLEHVASLIVIAVIIGSCFFIGLVERTRFGHFIFSLIEDTVFKRVPGYKIVRETISQFVGNGKSPFSKVALVKLYNSETRVTAFVTDITDDEIYTVFVPTGPNPTSGQIFHVSKSEIEILDYPAEAAMRSIIGCGTGSSELLHRRD